MEYPDASEAVEINGRNEQKLSANDRMESAEMSFSILRKSLKVEAHDKISYTINNEILY